MWLLLVVLALGAPKREDPLALPGLLVREGAWDRAGTALAAIDPAAKGLDLARYWTLSGLVALHDKRGEEAAAAFERALAVAEEGRELLELHLARAQLAAGRPDAAVAALERAGEVGASLSGSWLLRAQAEEAAGRPDRAWTALTTGAARFPEQAELGRQQVFLLVRLGLFREARALGETLLQRPDASADDAVAIAEALRRGGDLREAATILEAALLRDPDDRDLLVQAARAALDDGQARTAGRFLERAAVLDPALALEAAEAWRRAGDTDAALRLNGAVLDPVAKARQRLGLLIDAGEWERAAALDDRLVRLGLAEDDAIRYGLAYSHFRLGEHDAAEGWLAEIADPAVFRKATELRRAMATE